MILYLHGLNSSGQSLKARLLREALTPAEVVAPDYPAHRPHQAMAQLTALLSQLTGEHLTGEQLTSTQAFDTQTIGARLARTGVAGTGSAPIIVGSSMGGFYGQALARRFPITHLFMINPALQPWRLLPTLADTPMTTAAGEHYLLTPDLIEATRAYAVDSPCDGDDDGIPTTLLLDAGDELIDHQIAATLYRRCARVHIYPGGDHAFQHMDDAIRLIRAALSGSDPESGAAS
ncbi:alpha/beta fold hydrolase [Thiohalocapsa marina]|uniref:Alpha/beta fold hydrolase n=1 Tax=Thiohalocapsa marina TaxID=424902 RepID=A0A5M8FKN9_9GAMM|nr:YqiA/YcfP family alpha/beta fold hydrolase [Thiohalocapsa marina]KAA6184306.1 alpha/beta fold hydrolase [Thiohalocapsa marina]